MAEQRTSKLREALGVEVEFSDSASSTAVSGEEARDAARFRWYFSDKPKGDWLATYLDGVRIGWTTDQWRAAIDVALQASNGLGAPGGEDGK
jgi:hypothetical protein